MTELLIGLTAFVASLLSLFSGFGLGTILLPAFALFFPVEIAVASTAVVHGANSLFKTALLRRDIDRRLVLSFGIPAILSAALGAYLLGLLAAQPTLFEWQAGGRSAAVTPVRLVMALLILGFAFVELVPSFRGLLRFPARYVPIGGVLSGFFGGLSGHQGALRAAFLSPLGLTAAAFAATQAVLGLLVDMSRLLVYAATFLGSGTPSGASSLPREALLVAVVAAFAGALLGKRLLSVVTVRAVRNLTAILLILVALAIGLGVA